MLRMLLTVIAAVLAVKILLNILRPKKQQQPPVKGRPSRSSMTDRRADDIEDADFKEIK